MNYMQSDWLTKIQEHHVAITPYMLTDVGIIRDRCKNFRKLFPGVKIYYAVKAFSNQEVIVALADVADGFDAASIDEINTILNLGISPDRITYSNPVKPIETIHEAELRGVDKFAFQSREELEKIASCGRRVNVYVRTKVDDSYSEVPLSTKFGCAANEAVDLLQYAEKLGLNPAGITFHVGSQQKGVVSWKKAIKTSQELIKQAQARGLNTTVLNLGGGFPVSYLPGDPSIEDMAKSVNQPLKTDNSITYFAEPGRYLVAESSVIVSSIIGIEERQHQTWIWLDVGLFQAFVGATRFDPFPYPPYYIGPNNQPSKLVAYKKYVLTGPTCDSHDIITYEAKLPTDLKIGDRIVFPNTGAYTLVYGAPFNGFRVPQNFFIDTRTTNPKKRRHSYGAASRPIAKQRKLRPVA